MFFKIPIVKNLQPLFDCASLHMLNEGYLFLGTSSIRPDQCKKKKLHLFMVDNIKRITSHAPLNAYILNKQNGKI